MKRRIYGVRAGNAVVYLESSSLESDLFERAGRVKETGDGSHLISGFKHANEMAGELSRLALEILHGHNPIGFADFMLCGTDEPDVFEETKETHAGEPV